MALNRKSVENVNALIPQALQIADGRIEAAGGITTENRKGADGKPYAFCLWTEQFHMAMGNLTRESGLRK